MIQFWKKTHQEIDKVTKLYIEEARLAGFRPIKEIHYSQFIDEYRAGNPLLIWLGWPIVCKVHKHKIEHEELIKSTKSMTSQWEQLGNNLNNLEDKIKSFGGYIPDDRTLGVQSAFY